MEIKQIKELMSVMQRTGTKRLSIKREGIELELEREDHHTAGIYESPVSLIDDNPLKAEIAMHKTNMLLSRGDHHMPISHETPAKKSDSSAPGSFVTSPMVGTFYNTPSPEDPPFIKVGDKIEKDTVVCIIEAMKVMNEVKAGVSGYVAEVLVENGHPVEFATKLFRVTPAA